MDMTRDALQYVVGLKKAETLEINGGMYVDREVHRVDRELRAAALDQGVSTGELKGIQAIYRNLIMP